MSESRPPLRDSYEGLQSRAQATLRSGDLEGAIGLYRRLVEKLARLSDRVLDRRPDLSDLHRAARLELAGVLRVEGRYAEAIEVEQVLIETHPEEADAWRTDVAVMRVAKGEVDEGLAELQALAEEDPDNPWRWTILGREARESGRFAESEAALDRALALAGDEDDEQRGETHYQRFQLFKEMGRLDDAVAAWEEAIRWNPEVQRSIHQVYAMLTRAGRYSDALRFVARDENPLQAGYQRGLIAQRMARPDQARQEWQQVSRMDPGAHEYGHDAWVEAVLRLGDPDPALEWLQDALPRFGTPRLLVLSGIGWAMRRDPEVAAALFQQAISMQRYGRPRQKKLDSADWRLLDELVADDEIKAPLRTYFAVVETIWDRSPSRSGPSDARPLIVRP